MGLGVGIFLIAIGAILTWAVTKSPTGLNVHIVGVVLMVVGLLGILLDMLIWHSWNAWGPRRGAYAEGAPVRRGYAVRPRRRAVVVDEEVVPPAAGPPVDPPPY